MHCDRKNSRGVNIEFYFKMITLYGMNREIKRYIVALIITLGIFIAVFSLVNFLNTQKRANIRELQNSITVDLIANETQFDLLKNAPCKALSGEVLSKQLGELSEKLAYAEETQGAEKKAVVELKKYYSLLQVKDYLLSQEVAKKCDIQIESIVYFYEQDCSACIKQGYVLTELKRKYPWLRIYSFDLKLDFSIIQAFAGLYDLDEEVPVIIIGDTKYTGFKDISEIENYIPELVLRKEHENNIKKAYSFIGKEYNLDKEQEIFYISHNNREWKFSYLDEQGENVFIDLVYDKNTKSFQKTVKK